MKLLYVESQLDLVRQVYQRWLAYRSIRWDLVHCEGLQEAHSLVLQQGPFDAVLLGMQPPADESVVRQLAESVRPTPLIGLSAEPRQDWLTQGLDEWCDPNDDPRKLFQRIRIAIERSRRWETIPVSPGGVATEPRDGTREGFPGAEESAATPPDRDHDRTQVIHVLHVDPDETTRDQVRSALAAQPQSFALRQEADFAAALDSTNQRRFDVVVVELSLPDSDGLDTISAWRQQDKSTPLIVLTYHDDEATTLQSMQRGADDVFHKREFDFSRLPDLARTTVERSRRARCPISVNAPTSEKDRRRAPRYEVARPVFVIPILPNGSPNTDAQSAGTTVDLSEHGIGFLLPTDAIPSRRIVVGVEPRSGPVQFASAEVRHVTCLAGMTRFGAEFARGDEDLFMPDNLLPRLRSNHQMKADLPWETLIAWEAIGVMRRTLVGRGFVCPDCDAVPLVRNGCKACGSARLTCRRLIHHFACAHVDNVQEFQQDQDIRCPKCRANALIAGTDFEYLNGPYQCLECGWSDVDFETVGHCLHCDLRFPIHQASEEDFIGFHVERLDPLVLVDPS